MELGMRILKPLLLLIVLGFAPQASAITGEQAEFKKVEDNVYAFVGRRNDANALVVVTSQGVVLVDTANDPPQTRILQNFIKSITDQPVRYVIITQNHADHIGGTAMFTPPANVIVHDRIAQEWASWKPYQIKSWRKRFPERTEALKDVSPTDTVISFKEKMTLNLGGTAIELLYVDETYNPGDIAVWLPQSGVLHAGFAGYIDRHPDMRPDYSHGTTWGMLKQLEVFSALKPEGDGAGARPARRRQGPACAYGLPSASPTEGCRHDCQEPVARGNRARIQHERIQDLGPRSAPGEHGGANLPRTQKRRS